jgi:hypothetical protein
METIEIAKIVGVFGVTCAAIVIRSRRNRKKIKVVETVHDPENNRIYITIQNAGRKNVTVENTCVRKVVFPDVQETYDGNMKLAPAQSLKAQFCLVAERTDEINLAPKEQKVIECHILDLTHAPFDTLDIDLDGDRHSVSVTTPERKLEATTLRLQNVMNHVENFNVRKAEVIEEINNKNGFGESIGANIDTEVKTKLEDTIEQQLESKPETLEIKTEIKPEIKLETQQVQQIPIEIKEKLVLNSIEKEDIPTGIFEMSLSSEWPIFIQDRDFIVSRIIGDIGGDIQLGNRFLIVRCIRIYGHYDDEKDVKFWQYTNRLAMILPTKIETYMSQDSNTHKGKIKAEENIDKVIEEAVKIPVKKEQPKEQTVEKAVEQPIQERHHVDDKQITLSGEEIKQEVHIESKIETPTEMKKKVLFPFQGDTE